MSKRVLISVAVLAVSGQAFGQQVVSFYAEVTGAQLDIVADLPDDFILTDIFNNPGQGGSFVIQEGTDAGGWTTVIRLSDDNAALKNWSIRSGIPIAAGNGIRAIYDNGSNHRMTISGYIPGTGRGDIPAISGIGLGIMLLFIVAVGGFVFRRVKMAV